MLIKSLYCQYWLNLHPYFLPIGKIGDKTRFSTKENRQYFGCEQCLGIRSRIKGERASLKSSCIKYKRFIKYLFQPSQHQLQRLGKEYGIRAGFSRLHLHQQFEAGTKETRCTLKMYFSTSLSWQLSWDCLVICNSDARWNSLLSLHTFPTQVLRKASCPTSTKLHKRYLTVFRTEALTFTLIYT